jgi:hypothetical protein
MGLGSGIQYPRSGIRKKPIPEPGSRGQIGTGSRIRIHNTASPEQQGFDKLNFVIDYQVLPSEYGMVHTVPVFNI